MQFNVSTVVAFLMFLFTGNSPCGSMGEQAADCAKGFGHTAGCSYLISSDILTILAFFADFHCWKVAINGCHDKGNTWTELGDDAAISNAFHSLCENMAGTYKIRDSIINCVNINGHHIQAAIWPIDGHRHDYNKVDLSLDGCVDYMNQVKSRCPDYGGELDNLETNPDVDGGDWIKSLVMADPEQGTKHC